MRNHFENFIQNFKLMFNLLFFPFKIYLADIVNNMKINSVLNKINKMGRKNADNNVPETSITLS